MRDSIIQWPTLYPCVVGHEIVGTVVKTGSKVEGDIKCVMEIFLVHPTLRSPRHLQKG